MSGGKVQMKRSYAVAIVAALITSFVVVSPASAEKKPKVAKNIKTWIRVCTSGMNLP